ncbi:hypothetical protein F5Y18DRAFT_391159 [Xylariaceae sp. FL1019]|nr:hypothetical protein F5Y18DRAFT_391159 [Xylariaceae sp. FL1019]
MRGLSTLHSSQLIWKTWAFSCFLGADDVTLPAPSVAHLLVSPFVDRRRMDTAFCTQPYNVVVLSEHAYRPWRRGACPDTLVLAVCSVRSSASPLQPHVVLGEHYLTSLTFLGNSGAIRLFLRVLLSCTLHSRHGVVVVPLGVDDHEQSRRVSAITVMFSPCATFSLGDDDTNEGTLVPAHC